MKKEVLEVMHGFIYEAFGESGFTEEEIKEIIEGCDEDKLDECLKKSIAHGLNRGFFASVLNLTQLKSLKLSV